MPADGGKAVDAALAAVITMTLVPVDLQGQQSRPISEAELDAMAG